MEGEIFKASKFTKSLKTGFFVHLFAIRLKNEITLHTLITVIFSQSHRICDSKFSPTPYPLQYKYNFKMMYSRKLPTKAFTKNGRGVLQTMEFKNMDYSNIKGMTAYPNATFPKNYCLAIY